MPEVNHEKRMSGRCSELRTFFLRHLRLHTGESTIGMGGRWWSFAEGGRGGWGSDTEEYGGERRDRSGFYSKFIVFNCDRFTAVRSCDRIKTIPEFVVELSFFDRAAIGKSDVQNKNYGIREDGTVKLDK